MKLIPLRGYILVEQIDDEGKTSSGLIMPETAKDKPIKGIVLEVGEKALHFEGGVIHLDDGRCKVPDEPSQVKKGDKVVYKRWSTTDLEEDGKKLSFVAFADILGVYE